MKLITLTVLLLTTILCQSQKLLIVSQRQMDKVQKIINEDVYDSNNKKYGAGLNLEAYNMKICFQEIKLNSTKKEILLTGTTYSNNLDSNQLRLNGVEIFLAEVNNNIIRNKIPLGYSFTDTAVRSNLDGDFRINVNIKPHYYLYFNGGKRYRLVSFDLNKLLDLQSRHVKHQ